MRMTFETTEDAIEDVLRVVHAAYGVPTDGSDSIEAAPARPAKTTRRRSARAAAGGSTDAATVRTWAAENGYEVNARGALPKSVMDAFAASRS